MVILVLFKCGYLNVKYTFNIILKVMEIESEMSSVLIGFLFVEQYFMLMNLEFFFSETF